MPNTRDIRRRIKSVQATRQLTKAMKMVSAAKLRRSQERMLSARPYSRLMLDVLASLASRANPETHPLLADRGDDRIEVVVMTADKGLCGSFNTNIIKRAQGFLMEKGGKTRALHCVGKKGRDFFRRRKIPIAREYVDVFRNVDAHQAGQIANDLIQRFVSRELDAVYLIYNEFKSVIQQRVVVEPLLPIPQAALAPSGSPGASGEEAVMGGASEDYLYEPSDRDLFERLLPKHVEIQVYRALLESAAAEHGARMTAMDNATRNAEEMIETLTLQMNKIRQAAITKEILEVVSGAEALR